MEDIDCSQHSPYEIDLEVFPVIDLFAIVNLSRIQLLVCLLFFKQGFSVCILDYSGTFSVDQAGLGLTEICLSLPLRADIKCAGH